jgi:hypothetical protein
LFLPLDQENCEVFQQVGVELLDSHVGSIVFGGEGAGGFQQEGFGFCGGFGFRVVVGESS